VERAEPRLTLEADGTAVAPVGFGRAEPRVVPEAARGGHGAAAPRGAAVAPGDARLEEERRLAMDARRAEIRRFAAELDAVLADAAAAEAEGAEVYRPQPAVHAAA
jgi:hypothetical protein